MSLTRAQYRIYKAVETLIHERHCSPTFSEIALVLGLSSLATISKHVHALEDKGYITFGGRNRHRSIELVPEELRSWKSCAQGHEQVFYRCARCPVCAGRAKASDQLTEAF